MSSLSSTIKKFFSPLSTSTKRKNTSPESSPSKRSKSDQDHSPTETTFSSPSPDVAASPLSLQDYETCPISSLTPGPRYATFTCRVVNTYDQQIESKMPQSANGCLKLLVKDDTAMLHIKLYYATETYKVLVGTLLTVWTTHIHTNPSISIPNAPTTLPVAPIMTTIFPERDTGCQVQIHSEEETASSVCRNPLGYDTKDDRGQLPDLMSLEQFIDHGGNENPQAKLLVCVVAVGEVTTISTSSGASFQVLECTITDNKTDATLTLYSPLFESGASWTPKHTVLLLTFPRLRGSRLSLTFQSIVELNPSIPVADELRRMVQQAYAPINQPFPEGMFDVDAIETAKKRVQYTFASLHRAILDNPRSDASIAGYISVLLTQLNIVSLVKRKRLFSMPCCGMPIYSNALSGKCGQCGCTVALRINNEAVGGLADHTAGFSIEIPDSTSGLTNHQAVTSSRSRPALQRAHTPLLWSDRAWTELWGRDPQALAELTRDDVPSEQKARSDHLLKYLEQRLMYMRIIMLVGWMGNVDGGTLAVLRVVA